MAEFHSFPSQYLDGLLDLSHYTTMFNFSSEYNFAFRLFPPQLETFLTNCIRRAHSGNAALTATDTKLNRVMVPSAGNIDCIHSALFNTATPETYCDPQSPSTVSTGLSERRAGPFRRRSSRAGSDLLFTRCASRAPVSTMREPTKPEWPMVGTPHKCPSRPRTTSQRLGSLSRCGQPGAMRPVPPSKGVPDLFREQPGVDMGRTTVENVPDLFRGTPWVRNIKLGWFCRRVKGDASRRRGGLPRPAAVAPLCTCLLKSLEIPGGGLATLVHPCRGPQA
ncbi:hypothetical protein FB451DRAFT_1388559 [Mycena latifolia]|nr:hypothetical protein FB451DRAFT_1388559 [Mycena latifolia]